MELSQEFTQIRQRLLTTIGDAARALLTDLTLLEYRLPEECDPVKVPAPDYLITPRKRGRSSTGSEIDTQQNAKWTVLPSPRSSESAL